MGKKKKTTPQTKDVDRRTSLDASKSPSLRQPGTASSVRDLITVRLAPDSTKVRSKETSRPCVWMYESDMSAIDVVAGEQVILLAHEVSDSATIIGAAVCKVEASKTGPKSPLSSGKIQLSSSSVEHILLPRELIAEDTAETSAIIPPSPVKRATLRPSPSPATPSPSRFSFKTGGGGDKLYSPSSIATPSPNKPSTKATQANVPTTPIWIIPLDSDLGQRIQRSIIANAESLDVRVMDDSIDWKGCDSILERIILAHLVDRHVQAQETVIISFRGRPLELKVESSQECVLLEPFMTRMTLEDGDDASESIDMEEAAVESALVGSRVRLQSVTYATTINIVNETKKNMLDSSANSIAEQHVAGLTSTLEEVRSFLMTPLDHPELFQGTNLKPPRGILLFGTSGSGKTCLAKQLVLEIQSKFNVEYVNCVSLQCKTTVVGEAERELSRLFRPHDGGEKAKPTLLVMDDIHYICPKRGGYNPGTDRLAATLLSLVDGIDSQRNKLVLLAITTNPASLDPALRRPGRLDTEVEVPLPDEPSTRAEILRFHLEKLRAHCPQLTDSEWQGLGKLAKGFNGADCMLAVKEAVRLAILKHEQANESDVTGLVAVTTEDIRAAIRTTKPSAIKSVTVEIPQVKWSDIGGMDSVKRELRDAIEMPLVHAESMARLGIPAPRGILLYGPPGCSKTLMARALATEGQMNFLAVKGPELLSKWLGESERALASLFRRARLASPAIIFFDEIDSIAVKRGSSDSASSSRLLSQLLTELDGVNHTATDGKRRRVVVVGATNRPDLLDPALTRPGRIDRMIYVGIPDIESRKQIFTLSLRGRACGSDIDVDTLAQEDVSGGYSGAEIVAICRDAALLALEEADDLMSEHLPMVGMRHLLAAVRDTKGQITSDMLDFYANFTRSRDTFGAESFSLSDR